MFESSRLRRARLAHVISLAMVAVVASACTASMSTTSGTAVGGAGIPSTANVPAALSLASPTPAPAAENTVPIGSGVLAL